MRLLTFECNGRQRLGAELNGRIVDLQSAFALSAMTTVGFTSDALERAERFLPCDMAQFLCCGSGACFDAARTGLDFAGRLSDNMGTRGIFYEEREITRLAPVARPTKIICLGLNYRDHAIESGAKIPTEPVVFSKYPTAVIGPEAPIVLPPDSQKVDFEAELVFVIGRPGRNIPEADAMLYVAGYTCGHDVSARDYQLERGGGQWVIGKTFDTFAPLGPVLVTPDELTDPHHLRIQCRVNGETMQDSNTEQMIFNVPQTIAYLSRIMTLEAGDVVFTGTPPGVGLARKPPIYLKDGDVVEIEVEGIGVLRNPVRAQR
jgi:2-keto-4-pentenoate hydratase/2-oxohepta-3-ene-1,7-dioic acid hydratase in catechol pathway